MTDQADTTSDVATTTVPGWVTTEPKAPSTRQYRSAGTRARWLIGLLVVNLVASVIAVAISLQGKGLLSAFDAGNATIPELEAWDTTFAGFGLVEVAVYVMAAVAWLAWLARTVDNEDALGIGPSAFTPRWSIGWWFVPLANLLMPYRVHRDVQDRYEGADSSGHGIIVTWWVSFIILGAVGNIVGRIWLGAETVDELQTGLTMWLVSDLVTILTAVLAVVMVQRIQSRADVLALVPR